MILEIVKHSFMKAAVAISGGLKGEKEIQLSLVILGKGW